MTEQKRRGRPPKAVMEGAAIDDAPVPAPVSAPDPVPGNNGAALGRIVEYFKAEYPGEWEALRLCPLQHGVEEMVRLLR